MRIIPLVVFLSVPGSGSVASAQSSAAALHDSAYFAWREGDYVRALQTMDRVLAAPDGNTFVKPLALLTGELYRTIEVAPDGRAVRWAPDGRTFAYEVGQGADLRTEIVRVEGERLSRVAAVRGDRLEFHPAGQAVAYLRLEGGPALDSARVALGARIVVRDAESFRRRNREMAALEARFTRLYTLDLTQEQERAVGLGSVGPLQAAYGPDGALYVLGMTPDDAESSQVYRVGPRVERVTSGLGFKGDVRVFASHLTFTTGEGLGVTDFRTGENHVITASSPAVSADGRVAVYLARDGDGANTVNVVRVEPGAVPMVVARTTAPVANPAISPDGSRVAFQMMAREDWEVYVANADGSGGKRLTQEIQQDLFPQFLAQRDDLPRPRHALLAVMGEARHRRSQLYDLATGERIRLFHNNTVRTVAPEYEWAPSLDGAAVLVVAERDGDTISPERGVYLVRLDATVTQDELRERVARSLAHERALRDRGARAFAPIAESVRAAVADVSAMRIYHYAEILHGFGSKYMTQPGNAQAIEYLEATLRSFGYAPELQWFEPRPGVRTANVIATLPGTTNPELVYVVSSHFDSVERGPGADDNSSGTTALLEAARVLAGRRMPATIKFAFFTGEEAGLLGSREFVRRAVAAGERIVGALNNDMLGYANDGRLDNTIRYSNEGIRDLQHAAAFLFTRLITYDAKYYKSTDAHAYYEAYGDIVGGIGSYPILGNPHYHQSHDVLETINQELVAEVSRATVASVMALASSPARLSGLAAERQSGAVAVRWTPAPERGVESYVVRFRRSGEAGFERVTVRQPSATLPDLPAGSTIEVKAVSGSGMEGWDWARLIFDP